MHKIECPRCLGGKGEIRAFRHVQGGVCFRCKGRGYVEVKTIPKPSIRFVAMQKCKRRLSTVWQILKFLRG